MKPLKQHVHVAQLDYVGFKVNALLSSSSVTWTQASAMVRNESQLSTHCGRNGPPKAAVGNRESGPSTVARRQSDGGHRGMLTCDWCGFTLVVRALFLQTRFLVKQIPDFAEKRTRAHML